MSLPRMENTTVCFLPESILQPGLVRQAGGLGGEVELREDSPAI